MTRRRLVGQLAQLARGLLQEWHRGFGRSFNSLLFDARGIEYDVGDALPLPRVGNVHESVGCLDDRRIGELGIVIFQNNDRFPRFAIGRDCDIERRAIRRGIVVNEERASIFKLDGINAAIRVRQGSGSGIAPGFAIVGGPPFVDFFLMAAAKELEEAVAVIEKRGLDEFDGIAVVEGLGFRPGLAEITRGFEMDFRAVVFGARGGEDGAIGKLNGFVLGGTDDAIGKTMRCGPGCAVVGGAHHHAPPGRRGGAYFIEEEERAVFGLEKNGIPTGETGSSGLDAGGNFDEWGPMRAVISGNPDSDVRSAFAGAAEPRRDEARLGLRDG
jgi:hypothetical protein